MAGMSRSQLFVYGAVALALLVVGARAIAAEGDVGGGGRVGAVGGSGAAVTMSATGSVVVDVAGAVLRPGVYRLPAGARVRDALRRAGGATSAARLEAINRAARLADGQQVVVPSAVRPAGEVVAGAEAEGPVSLGTATAEQLDEIEGIGPVTAEKIVEFRDGQGGLASVEQLDEISGIGPATMESLRAALQP